MIHSLTQQLSKDRSEIQASRTELESAELPIMATILDQPKTPEPATPTLCSMDREREMARKREQERRRREAVSTIHLCFSSELFSTDPIPNQEPGCFFRFPAVLVSVVYDQVTLTCFTLLSTLLL